MVNLLHPVYNTISLIGSAGASAAPEDSPPTGPALHDSCACKTDSENRCTQDAFGQKGEQEKPRITGQAEIDGVPNVNAKDVTSEYQDVGVCFNCPAGT